MDPLPDTGLVTHKGGCHCGAITFKVTAPTSVTCLKCNCSNCTKRGITYFMIPAKNFTLLTGQSKISTYTFGTHTAKHTFCSVCGITPFFTPRLNIDWVAVTLGCVDHGTIEHVEFKDFDGQNEESFA